MNRTKKNFIMIVIAVALAGCMVFTAQSAGRSLLPFSGTPPVMQGGLEGSGGPDFGQSQNRDDQNANDQNMNDQNADGQNGDNQESDNSKYDSDQDVDNSTNKSDQSSDNSKRESDQNADKNASGSTDSGNNQKGTPPAPPNGDSDSENMPAPPNGNSDSENMPAPPDGNFDSENMPTPPDGNGGSENMPTPPDGDFDGKFDKASISDISVRYFILFGVEGLAFALILMYLIMSGMNRKSFRETFAECLGTDSMDAQIGTDNTDAPIATGNTDAPIATGNTDAPIAASDTDTQHEAGDTDIIPADTPAAGVSGGVDEGSARSTKKIAVFVIAVILIAGGLTVGQAALATTAFALNGPDFSQQMPGGPGSDQNGSGQNGSGQNGGQSSVTAAGATTVDGTEETLNDTYTSTNADENAILVTNGGTLISNGATINKKSGDSSNTGSSDFSGVNAGLLVQEKSTATVKNATIKTSAKGANAVFATGENAKVTISDSTITTTGEASSRGLDATYGGAIEADNVTITTQGGSCAAMATDRGEGTVTASKSKLETNGAGSPLIYSTGDITLTDSEGTANGAQIAVVEGKNSAIIEDSEVTCSGAGNRGDVDIAGVMVYQSMSGDAGEGTGNFTAKDSDLTISKDSDYYKTAPMFFVTNTTAVIDLEDTDLHFGSGVLLSAKGTSEWGKEGANGGDVTLNAKDETLKGDIQLDEISSLCMKMNNANYKGTINGDNTAKSVELTLDKDSKITLTGDSYVTSLEDADSTCSNIDFNGYKLYVDGKAIN